MVIPAIAWAQPEVDVGKDVESNNRRHGFIIGFGIGPGYVHLSQDHRAGPLSFGSGSFDEGTSEFAINTDFKIGYAADEQTLLYFNTRAAWFREKLAEVALDSNSGSFHTVWNDEIFANAISGIGLSYYTRPTLPA